MTCFRMDNGHTMSRYCKENNLNYETAKRFCDLYGMTPEQAVKKTQYRRDNNITKIKHRIDGKSLPDWCREVKIKYSSVFSRSLAQNITPVQAALDMFRERYAR